MFPAANFRILMEPNNSETSYGRDFPRKDKNTPPNVSFKNPIGYGKQIVFILSIILISSLFLLWQFPYGTVIAVLVGFFVTLNSFAAAQKHKIYPANTTPLYITGTFGFLGYSVMGFWALALLLSQYLDALQP